MSQSASPPQAQLTVAPADVTIVETGSQLQEAAFAHAQDIEIRAHLDLRGLTRPPNPDLPGVSSGRTPHNIALLYARQGMRSMRGNCSDPDPAAALGLSPEDLEAAPLLPLKPRQCLLLVPDSLLMSNGGPFWLDNLYLRAFKTKAMPDFAFLMAGALGEQQGFQMITAGDLYVTNVTMQGEGRGTAVGIALEEYNSNLLLKDCILTDWVGWRSPLNVFYDGLANVVDTVFRNMRLPVELADVSNNGVVRFERVSLANVALQAGAVVSTTSNDYLLEPEFNIRNLPEDDEGFDVELTPVPVAARGPYGAEFRIENDVMSDCVYLKVRPGTVSPGCPASSVQARERVLSRGENNVSAVLERAVFSEAPTRLAEDLLVDTAPWLQAMRAALGALLPPPPGWPPFAPPPPENPVARDGIAMAFPVAEGVLAPGLSAGRAVDGAFTVGPQGVPAPVPAAQPSDSGGEPGTGVAVLVGVLAVLLAAAVAAGVWAATAVRRLRLRPRPPRTVERPAATNPLRAWLTYWMSNSSTGTDTKPNPTESGSSLQSVVGDGSTRPRGTLPPPAAGAIPPSAMNPDFEYALPTVVARLMGATIFESEEIEIEGHKPDPKRTLMKSSSGSANGSGNSRTRTLAVTQPISSGSRAGSQSTDGSGGLTVTAMRRPVSSTEPIAGTASAAVSSRENSLRAESEEPGSTIVVSPYALTHSTRSASTVTGTATAPFRIGTVDGTISTSASESPATPATASGGAVHNPSTRAVVGETVGGTVASTVTAPAGTAAAGDGDSWWTSGTLPAVEEARPVIHGIRMGRMHLADERSGVLSEADSWTAAGGGSTAADCGGRTGEGLETRDAMFSRLQRQLDGFRDADLFLGRFEMLGQDHRRQGGQAVVQFAEDTATRCDFAVKFFLDWDSFLTEAALYAAAFPHIRGKVSAAVLARADATTAQKGAGDTLQMSDVVARFLPQVEAVCDGAAGGLEDPRGRPLPPCIVMEKGESLHDWSDRAQPDLFTSLAVLSNISLRLADMHSAGYVHRDLKPANVMWLPRQNRWTVIDFGCVARVGQQAPLSFTLAYAAPEVVRAFFLQQRSIESAPALDAWSLGVMAYELLTGAPPFDVVRDGRVGVMKRLRGDLPLPWEGEMSASVRIKLGAFREPVLQLLHREPGERTSMRAFHATCTMLFAVRTTFEV